MQIDEQSLTKRSFPHLFVGSELVVAGRIQSGNTQIDPDVKAVGASGSWSTTGIVKPPVGYHLIFNFLILINIKMFQSAPLHVPHKPAPLERLWAYLMIKQLLDEKDAQLDTEMPKVENEEKPHAEPNALMPQPKKETAKEKALKLALKVKKYFDQNFI